MQKLHGVPWLWVGSNIFWLIKFTVDWTWRLKKMLGFSMCKLACNKGEQGIAWEIKFKGQPGNMGWPE